MLFISNLISVLFYLSVFLENPYRHDLSQLRSLLQTVILFTFSIGLAIGRRISDA